MSLTVQSLACRRGGRQVFKNISFSLEPGGLLLVTGANGGGKSSLLRLLAGLLPATAGAVCWRGISVQSDLNTFQQQLVYIGHHDAVKPELTVDEMLTYWCALAGQNKNGSVLATFDLMTLRNQAVHTLSAGQRRRLALTRLLLASHPLWLLDEPMTALDAKSQTLFLAALAQHRAAGGMVVMVVHHLPEGLEGQQLVLESCA